MNRNQRAILAQETLNIIEQGGYTNLRGEFIDIAEKIRNAIGNSLLYNEERLSLLPYINAEITDKTQSSYFERYKVRNCTTFEGVRDLLQNSGKVICLNFASSKNPGGGFLGGSQAQEEALTRASALYPCLTKYMDMYLNNRRENRLLYSHDMIYSSDVPVFRDDSGALLNKPFEVSIITSAAVNAGVALRKRPGCEHEIRNEMKSRARYILSVAINHGYRDIVLGAWGCGVFKNRPEEVASIFHELFEVEKFKHYFRNIYFSVLDLTSSTQSFQAFDKQFVR